MEPKRKDLNTLNTWVDEAQFAAQSWRDESWRDCAMYDGGDGQWTQEDWDRAVEAGIDPITINKTFPTINLILGSEAINKNDIVAKGRTQEDSETQQIMTEGMKFIFDQCDGQFLLSEAFKDSVIPGFGCLSPTLSNDPRKEKLTIRRRDWKEIWYDPFSSPWFNPRATRYLFMQKWLDVDEIASMFPKKRQEINDLYTQYGNQSGDQEHSRYLEDQATMVEDHVRESTGFGWIDTERKRMRPVEMWYPVYETLKFAEFPDGRALELNDRKMPRQKQYEIVRACDKVITATVKKMKVCAFIDHLELMHIDTPFTHDEYPFIPLVGYVDRLNQPFGVPRQIRGQDEEVNKRRSMALAMLSANRVIMESGVAGDDKAKAQKIWEEAQKINGRIVVEKGQLQNIQIDERNGMLTAQVQMGELADNEVQEISGANAEMQGHQTNATSGKAIQARQQQGAVQTSTLFDNLRRSAKLLGDQIIANIQGNWQGEKVLRITDRMGAAEHFVTLNQKVMKDERVVEVKNDITQGIYDVIVSQAPQTDTVREQNMNLIIEWVKKSPPEIIPHLMHMAFELSNLPNKDQILAKIKPLLGADPDEDDMSPDEIKEKVTAELKAAQEEQQRQKELQDQDVMLQLNEKKLKNIETEAKIQEAMAKKEKIMAETLKIQTETEKSGGIDSEKVAAEINKIDSDIMVDRAEVRIDLMEKTSKANTEAVSP